MIVGKNRKKQVFTPRERRDGSALEMDQPMLTIEKRVTRSNKRYTQIMTYSYIGAQMTGAIETVGRETCEDNYDNVPRNGATSVGCHSAAGDSRVCLDNKERISQPVFWLGGNK